MSDNLEYTIEGKQMYGSDIYNITQKNSSKFWRSQTVQHQINIVGHFKEPAYVVKIQLKGYQTECLQIIFKDMDKAVAGSAKMQLSVPQQALNRNICIKQRISQFQLILTPKRSEFPKYMGLNFLLFKGQKDALKVTKQKYTNISKQPTFDRFTHQSKNTDKIGQKKPITATVPSKPYAHHYLKQKKTQNNRFYNDRQRRQVPVINYNEQHKQKEEDQLQKALKMSKMTHAQQMRQKKLQKETTASKNQDKWSDSDTEPLEQERNYETHPLADMVNACRGLNERWLQAQRKAQIRVGVRQEERLSNYVILQQLHNYQFLIDQNSFNSIQKSKLESLAQSMGARIISKPDDYCYIVSNSLDNPGIREAIKKYDQVKLTLGIVNNSKLKWIGEITRLNELCVEDLNKIEFSDLNSIS